jgi:hypothetical protein
MYVCMWAVCYICIYVVPPVPTFSIRLLDFIGIYLGL